MLSKKEYLTHLDYGVVTGPAIRDYFKELIDGYFQLEQALDKACDLIKTDVCISCYACPFEKDCHNNSGKKCFYESMSKEEWKQWCMKN